MRYKTATNQNKGKQGVTRDHYYARTKSKIPEESMPHKFKDTFLTINKTKFFQIQTLYN